MRFLFPLFLLFPLVWPLWCGWTRAASLRPASTVAFQLKAVEKGVYPEKILKEMPTDRGEYNVVVHKKKGYQPTVSMTWDDFYEILEMLVTNKIL